MDGTFAELKNSMEAEDADGVAAEEADLVKDASAVQKSGH